MYVTPIKLQNVEGNRKIESIKIGSNTLYGINEMYTMSNYNLTTNFDETGMIYLYLPLGEKEITIKVNGSLYSEIVETKENMGTITLTKQ